jgi:hypothetical protein
MDKFDNCKDCKIAFRIIWQKSKNEEAWRGYGDKGRTSIPMRSKDMRRVRHEQQCHELALYTERRESRGETKLRRDGETRTKRKTRFVVARQGHMS